MNHFDSSLDDYEDVPSPLKSTTTTKTSARANLFSRPVGTVSSEAPVVTPTTTRRRPVRAMDEMDFAAPPKRRAIAAPQVDYLDEDAETDEEEIDEEEVTERRPAVRPRAKTKVKTKTALLPRIGWGIAVFMLLRLIFMERGVLQYWNMSGTIGEHEQELSRVRKENSDIRGEIQRVGFDKGHQKQLAKEHLGVIAADEFLIL